MSKKVWSIILLGLIILAFIFTVLTFVSAGVSLHQIKNAEIDVSDEVFPGSSIFAVAFSVSALLIGGVFFGGVASSIGFICSLINVKISQGGIIKKISKVFFGFNTVLLILIISVCVFGFISIF